MAEYTQRNVSFDSDWVPAILGLARRMEPLLGREFVAGAWRGEYFMRSLLWRVVFKDTSPEDPSPAATADAAQQSSTFGNRYPSWTWASSPGSAVDYELIQNHAGSITRPTSLVFMNLVLEGKAQTSAAGTLLEGPMGKVDRSGKSKSHFD